MIADAKDKTTYLNLHFNNIDLTEAVGFVEEYIFAKIPRTIFTLGAELVVRAQNDKFLREVYNSADLLTVDSNVVFDSAGISGFKFKEPVSAVRLVLKFLEENSEKNYRYYILGAKQDVLESAVKNLKLKYPGIVIAGYHNGYFDIINDNDVVEQIKAVKPDILLVAMSSPLKEIFISRNYKKMGVPVSIGVGGAIDVIAGKAKLAHPLISKLGLEWFFRFIQEPGRLWKRYFTTNTLFVWYVMINLFRRNK